ncbi:MULTISPECIES: SDR family NAD(P)-dependent oxidoreductase [Methylobacterium]|uniref:3-oxoacyl-[acyl-carrier-protein] reductase FabG n=1 Tax=Methylobacterium jeotgali TaxID=381630 RepID=A0ABQ4SWG4_9HYPH|nr:MULTISPECIES: SDR family NAD(P)-dependent oxidoreductase [Methylobacterium]PIU08756.1 MAG: short-chain dehydrogenase [Methylobacterium sp. CG09_land_8_20_14_0_10_71_15]PIU16368.1 MAG: short-chain dehydrogenase [Methylobacterium sp. CG08_land_8_20_14_0_20_71_15]GBU16056.1 oxidoreductase [Methylobacterium sp.]GJE07222.1 3-oxoacyl-[acyl-carrier-protein] reductase FabG [Methylobacterium jeotgali]
MSGPLAGKVCLVAGASRGVGRGIARGLGEAGATVIVTARSSETGARTEMRSEAVEDTAREVDAAGGDGHHYLCDHTSERAVDGLVHWALRRFGRIDVAVSSVWGGNEGYDGERYPDGSSWGTPFWRRSAEPYGGFLEVGPYAGLLLARAVAPAMVAAKSGLIALVSFDTGEGYLGDIYYDLAKTATNRLALAFSAELKPYGVTALALSPGFVRTERVIEAGHGDMATESPLYAGRALAALAADPEIAARSGQVLHAGDLARHYGFTDADGSRPPRFRVSTGDER